jgi:hypothetical protein|tara:strand:- start:414 stop:1148 length:735 start_codon:yes stop_codon:yes gene_type:complete
MEVYLGEHMKILEYNTEKYYFSKLISSLFDIDLSNLDSDEEKTNLTLGKDTHTSLHKVFYNKLDGEGGWPEFENLYKAFVREVIFPLFEDDTLIYQGTPGIRFNRPGAKAVYRWHSDGDSHHKHPLGELNVYLPLTKSVDNNTVWAESLPGLGDFAPVNLEYGQFMLGYLNQCRHGNMDNDTGKTRVSFDFRVMPGFAYDDTCPLVTCTTKQPFKVGGYYSTMNRDETPDTFDPIENAKLGAAC